MSKQSMSSYEVVYKAIEFKSPDRLPIRFDDLGLTDVITVKWNQIGPGNWENRESVDEWGCTWIRTSVNNMGQVKIHPLEDWKSVKNFNFPDPDNPGFYDKMDEQFNSYHDKYILLEFFMLLFERLHSLHGFKNTLEDLYIARKKVENLADIIVDFNIRVIKNISRRFPDRIHGLWFTDDWGSQQDIFINPNMWREIFKPRYKLIFDEIHKFGWHVWMHSCGKINSIIEDLIEIGLDVINLQQPRVLGIEDIGHRFKGKICFETLCDIQKTLPFKTEKDIRCEAKLILNQWATPEGGFILSDYGGGHAIGVEYNKKEIMLNAFLQSYKDIFGHI